MKNRKLKKWVVYAVYAMSFVILMGTIYLIDSSSFNIEPKILYVKDIILDNTLPVSKTNAIILQPYLDGTVKIVRYYYNPSESEDMQEKSLVYYQETYLPNSGVDYKNDDSFDVVASLDGVVTKITESSLLGKIIEITHTNNLITVYQSLGEVMVNEGEEVIQGQIIAKSGESNISTELGNHLHFEIIFNGENINPEMCYGKEIDKL